MWRRQPGETLVFAVFSCLHFYILECEKHPLKYLKYTEKESRIIIWKE